MLGVITAAAISHQWLTILAHILAIGRLTVPIQSPLAKVFALFCFLKLCLVITCVIIFKTKPLSCDLATGLISAPS